MYLREGARAHCLLGCGKTVLRTSFRNHISHKHMQKTKCHYCDRMLPVDKLEHHRLMCGLKFHSIGYVFAFYATKMGSKDFGKTKVDLIGSRTLLCSSKDPNMALQYTKHGPLYIGYIFTLYAKKGVQGTLGTERSAPLCLGPALVLQWTLPWPYNTPNMA